MVTAGPLAGLGLVVDCAEPGRAVAEEVVLVCALLV